MPLAGEGSHASAIFIPSKAARALRAAAKELSAQRPRLSLREIAAELEVRGYTNSGKRYPAMSVRNMLLG
jgi:hypothetical protein